MDIVIRNGISDQIRHASLPCSAVVGVHDYGIRVGAEANLLCIEARSAVEALRRQPERRFVIRKGKLLAGTRRKTIWHIDPV